MVKITMPITLRFVKIMNGNWWMENKSNKLQEFLDLNENIKIRTIQFDVFGFSRGTTTLRI